jgi:hypothetical protein
MVHGSPGFAYPSPSPRGRVQNWGVATAVVIYGPKAVGKSLIAQIHTDQLGVYHVDTDALVLRALAQGLKPHPVLGWLRPVRVASLKRCNSYSNCDRSAVTCYS